MDPKEPEFFASLDTLRSRGRIARLFAPPVWSVRMCSWTDYELSSSFAELVLEAESPILLSGWVADVDASVDRILTTLRTAGIAFDAECYGSDGQLKREIHWNPPKVVSARSMFDAMSYAIRVRSRFITGSILVLVGLLGVANALISGPHAFSGQWLSVLALTISGLLLSLSGALVMRDARRQD